MRRLSCFVVATAMDVCLKHFAFTRQNHRLGNMPISVVPTEVVCCSCVSIRLSLRDPRADHDITGTSSSLFFTILRSRRHHDSCGQSSAGAKLDTSDFVPPVTRVASQAKVSSASIQHIRDSRAFVRSVVSSSTRLCLQPTPWHLSAKSVTAVRAVSSAPTYVHTPGHLTGCSMYILRAQIDGQ